MPRAARYQRSKDATYRWHMSHGQDDAPATPWGRYVKGLADRDGWSVARLARESGIDRGTIFRWIRGENERVTVEMVKTVATAAGDDIDRALRAAAGLPLSEETEQIVDEFERDITDILASDLPDWQKRAMVRYVQQLQRDHEEMRARQSAQLRSQIKAAIEIARHGHGTDPDPQPAT